MSAGTLEGLAAPAGEDGYDRLVAEIREMCGGDVTEGDVWHYIYGVMHAPDWRERFAAEMESSAPRFPLPESAETFWVFARAGEDLMELHADYDNAEESLVPQLAVVRDEGDGEGKGDEGWEGLRIPPGGMRWKRVKDEETGRGRDDLTHLDINERVSFDHIPPQAHAYRVAGHSPLEWAVKELTYDEEWGEDPNRDPRWKDDPLGLITHLRRLTYVGVRTAEITEGLPPSLGYYEGKEGQ